MRLGLIILFTSPALLLGELAHAERGEWSAGISSGLFLPALQAQDATSFRVASFVASFQARYGLLDALDLGLTGSWARLGRRSLVCGFSKLSNFRSARPLVTRC